MNTKERPKQMLGKASSVTGKIPPEQWNMPVSFTSDGSVVSLKEYVRHSPSRLSLSQLSPEQRAELTAKRIEIQPVFAISMIGAGSVDKQRAIAEVRAQSSVGRVLIEIEQRLINYLVQQAESLD